jgi:hypothetical protein
MVAFQPRGGVLNMARPITLRRARSSCGTHLVAWGHNGPCFDDPFASDRCGEGSGARVAGAEAGHAEAGLGAQGGREGRPLGRNEAGLQNWVAAMLWDLSETVSPGGPRVT